MVFTIYRSVGVEQAGQLGMYSCSKNGSKGFLNYRLRRFGEKLECYLITKILLTFTRNYQKITKNSQLPKMSEKS